LDAAGGTCITILDANRAFALPNRNLLESTVLILFEILIHPERVIPQNDVQWRRDQASRNSDRQK
jgi:hypothetical protein